MLPPASDAVDALARLLRDRRTVVLSGAGISTESGIPDYRGPGRRDRPHRPITYQQFVRSEEARRRYWARSVLGWPRMRGARPNAGHRSLAGLERAGRILGTITQNVDGLHQAGGSREVIELHGSLGRVRCLDCGSLEPRDALQRRLLARNPGWRAASAAALPDGDADLPADALRGFHPVACARCAGMLKPDVVFFGENVPAPRVARCRELLGGAEALLVVGSSLAVRSGLRFVEAASAAGVPVAIINDGQTRGDALARVRLGGRLGEVLPRLAERLGGAA